MSRKYTKELLEPLCKKHKNMVSVLKELGLSPKGGMHAYITNLVKEYEINISHFKKGSCGISSKNKLSKKEFVEKYLLEDSDYGSARIRTRLIRFGIKSPQCENCGLTEWLGEKITFSLHHINHVHSDNRLRNLQILCPNCHRLKHMKK